MGALSYIAVVLVVGAPGPVELEWTAPAECPSRAEVLERLRAELPDAEVSGLRARMTVRKEGDGFVLDAVVGTGQGQSDRRLEASTCSELADATVVLITLALTREMGGTDETLEEPASTPDEALEAPGVPSPADGSPGDATEDTPPSSEPDEPRLSAASESAVSPTREPASGPPPDRSRRARVEGRAGVFGGVTGLALPVLTGSLTAEGGVGGRGWEATLGAHYWIRRQAMLGLGTRGRFELVAANLRGCGVPSAGPVDFPLCGIVTIGAVLAAGTEGLVRARSAAHPWVSLGASAGVRWWIGERWGLALRGSALVAPARPSFELGGIGEVCCDRVGLEGALGVVGRWGRNGSGRVRTITPDASAGAPNR
ncbi:MAG: hypothetical protein AB1Z98_27800 [Nannocystaceae bacterium]